MYISTITLLLSNVMMYYFAKTEAWSISTVLIVYWSQSVIIGFFQVLKIYRLKTFSTENFTINSQHVLATTYTKWYTMIFFSIHYGFFHIIYLVFLSSGMFGPFQDYGSVDVGGVHISGVLITVLTFFINHLISYYTNNEAPKKPPNIGSMMFFPYLRIIPMHLTIIFGLLFRFPLELFMILKTGADVAAHLIEHGYLRKLKKGIPFSIKLH